jgi:hypothetical protein
MKKTHSPALHIVERQLEDQWTILTATGAAGASGVSRHIANSAVAA